MARLRLWVLAGLLAATVVAALAGCSPLFPPVAPEPPNPDAQPAEENSPDAAVGAQPLFVGARWVYRNATSDLIPVLHPGSEIETEVLAEVRCRDALSGLFRECFVVRTRQGAGRETVSYLHRAPDGIEICAIETRAPGTASSRGDASQVRTFPSELFLRPALVLGESWSFGQRAGDFLSSEVLGRETVPLRDTILTLLGPYTSCFTNAWRVRSTYGGILADAYGGGIVECWYSTGVGMVKRTAESLFYELVAFRKDSEVKVLHAASAQGPYYLPVGSLVIVQVRGHAPTAEPGIAWDVANSDEVAADGILGQLSLSGEFYADRDGVEDAETGTYVFRFAVEGRGSTTLVLEGRYAPQESGWETKSTRFDFVGT